MAKKNALGRGLGALIDVSDDQQDRQLIHSPSAVSEIPIKKYFSQSFPAPYLL